MEIYKEFLSKIIMEFLYSGFWVYIPTQALVYIFGRMFGILNANWSRNLLALISTIVFSYFYVHLHLESKDIIELFWNVSHWISMGIMWYVLLGFHLADRMDHFLDKRFADDEEPKKKK